ncbi:MAG: hypothetical protein ACFFBE_10645 [Promethearchaeota archaeon]
MEPIKKDFENTVYKFFFENKGKAFTFRAIREQLKNTITSHKSKDIDKTLLTVLKNLREQDKIKGIRHNGKIHLYLPEIFKSAPDDNQMQYFIPEVYISSDQDKKREKKKYCKYCKKEVVAERRSQKGVKEFYSASFPILSSLTQKSIEARVSSGRFCPNCGEKFINSKAIVIVWLISLSIWAVSIIYGFIVFNEDPILKGDISSFIFPIIVTVIIFFLLIYQVLNWISKKIAKKKFEKMKSLPQESLKLK